MKKIKRSGLFLALTWILFTNLGFSQGAPVKKFALEPPIKVVMNRQDIIQDTLFKGSVSLYKVFRDVSFVYILMYGVALSVALAFGQAQVDAILNYFLGSAVVIGANIIASIYFAVYSIKLT